MLRRDNKRFTEEFTRIPPYQWPEGPPTIAKRMAVLRNKNFLVQIFQEEPGYRISVNRTALNKQGEFDDGITWDELFTIKNAVGYGDMDAVELYPRERDIVNVANMRHLWVFNKQLPFGWRKPT